LKENIAYKIFYKDSNDPSGICVGQATRQLKTKILEYHYNIKNTTILSVITIRKQVESWIWLGECENFNLTIKDFYLNSAWNT